jgi:hypothetical protein
MNLDIGRSFTYMFEDENWIMKIVIGGLLSLIPIVGSMMVLGYMLEALKRVADGMDIPLPEWDDFGGKLIKGLMVCIIGLVYAIPVIVLACCAGALTLFLGGGESNAAGDMATMVSLCTNCLSLIWGIVMWLVLPGVCIRYAVTGDFMSAFQFGEIFSFISSNIANYIVAIILVLVANFIAGFGIIACFVGVLFTSFWAYLVMGHLLGQVQRESLAVA